MESTLVRILEKLFIIYFAGYFILDIVLFIIFLFSFWNDKRKYEVAIELNEFFRKVSIIVPAYNEEVSIVNCVNMLANLDYPDFEIIVVNDGSRDKTLDVLHSRFLFKPAELHISEGITTSKIRSVHISEDGKLLLLDKYNGGKADAINAGINYSSGEFICTIDADSILDRASLRKVIMPMLMDKRVFVTGGQLAISNDAVIENNEIVNARMPGNIWILWQITEYIKSFLVSRIGLSKLNSLLIMSGAFSVFRKDDLQKVGGFLNLKNDHSYIKGIFKKAKQTVCEDMEIVVRLWRYYYENGKEARIVYLSKPLCWTEAPENAGNLLKQRSRWHLGLAQCLFLHHKMMFDPKYSVTGLFAFPYYFFFELMSPFVKTSAIFFILYASFTGLVNSTWAILIVVLATLTTAFITSFITVVIERWSQKQSMRNLHALRYKTFSDWFILLLAGIVGDFSYSFFKIYSQFKGLWDFARERSEWNKFERKGIRKIVSSPGKAH